MSTLVPYFSLHVLTATRGGNRCAAQPSGATPLRTVDGLNKVVTIDGNQRTSSSDTFGPVTGKYVIAMARPVLTPVMCGYLPSVCMAEIQPILLFSKLC